jgi:hypothetical protein
MNDVADNKPTEPARNTAAPFHKCNTPKPTPVPTGADPVIDPYGGVIDFGDGSFRIY